MISESSCVPWKDDVYEKYISDELIKAGFQFDGDKLVGGDELIGKFRETHADAFKDSEPVPKISAKATGTTVQKDDSILRSVMGLK